MEELIGDLADRGTTVLVATNDIAGIEGVADRIGILHGGALLLNDEVEAVKARFRRLVARNRETVQRLREATGERLEVVRSGASGGGYEAVVAWSEVPEPTAAVPGSRLEAMSLEDIFVALCGPGDGRQP